MRSPAARGSLQARGCGGLCGARRRWAFTPREARGLQVPGRNVSSISRMKDSLFTW